MKKAKLKINKDFPARKLKKGFIISLLVDDNDIPLDMYWRRRLKDSQLDDCVEILGNKKDRTDNTNKIKNNNVSN